jgi:hypothetical protein
MAYKKPILLCALLESDILFDKWVELKSSKQWINTVWFQILHTVY